MISSFCPIRKKYMGYYERGIRLLAQMVEQHDYSVCHGFESRKVSTLLLLYFATLMKGEEQDEPLITPL